MDITSIILRDHDIPARDDYSNIDQWGIFASEEKLSLREMNGLRNRIIHRYNATDEQLALEQVREYRRIVPNFLEKINAWLNQT